LNINEDIAYRQIISCTNVTKIKTIGMYSFRTKCKWVTKFGGRNTTSPEVSWKLKYKIKKWLESRNSNGAVVIVTVAERT
jgi:hypothetical protein